MRLMIGMTAAAAWAASATAQDLDPAAQLKQLQFRDIDADDDGLSTAGEFAAYGDLIMVSIDFDESGDLVEQEFVSWG